METQRSKAPVPYHGMAEVNGGDSEMKEIQSSRCFGGWQKFYSHKSYSTKCQMKFSVYLPPQSEEENVPVLYFLAGWRCTEATFPERSGMQQYAAKHGVMVVTADTSPRFDSEIDSKDPTVRSGEGASFYLNATEPMWKDHYQMFTYVSKELPDLIDRNFPVLPGRQSIMGHSMGGHGALISFLKNPEKYCSVSAFAPVCNPMSGLLSEKVLTKYLGNNPDTWKEYDATELLRNYSGPKVEIKIDQGTGDKYFKDGTLQPDVFAKACKEKGYPLDLNYRESYGHSFYFVSSFIKDHFEYHACYLKD